MSVGVLVLPILILIALAVGVLVYYICYKAAINRKLREEESGAHVPMASMETVWKVVAVIAVFVMYSSLSSKITNLQTGVREMNNALQDRNSQLQYKLEEIQKTMKQEASMVSGVYYDFGEIDTKEHKAELKVWVAPKSYSEETEVSVVFRGERIVLTNDGRGTFAGTAKFPMFEEVYEEGMIFVTEGGITKTEAWEDAPQGKLSYDCLPQLVVANSSFGYHKKKNSVKMEGELRIMSSEKKTDQFRELTLFVTKGTEVIEEIALKDGYVRLDKEYPITDGDYFEIYLTGVDEYGYTHKEYIAGWSTDEMSQNVRFMEENQVIYTDEMYGTDISIPAQ